MSRIKPLAILGAVLFAIILLIPTFLVLPFTHEKHAREVSKTDAALGSVTVENGQVEEPAIEVAVYRTKTKKIAKIPLEEYVKGVVASEMPAEFEIEALKAQALTARTYIVKQLLEGEPVGAPKGAVVTDTVIHQVYKSPEELKAAWGAANYDWKMARINEAVEATRGQIITYNNEPITASFFSTSNGYTENSEDYWKNSFPYLRSVESPWDQASPKFINKVTIPIAEFEKKLGVKVTSDKIGEIVARTAGNRVAKVKINDKTFDGREIREKLNLYSSDFTWKKQGDYVVITTKGYGHGVGMSQYGANGMAAEGKTVKEIIAHYYQGTEISSIEPFLNDVIVAQK
ncbi:stage II sporulation protein D [Calidifontibacillus erzurumensis]|uniref:Stage II sporulation protein D n=1 Tax=Calidifontibacillus erzurumensis TaxID=2741433 RepID=A0A8J8GEV8_9BACI|nr:stage II sporulation protein D [Calidifontibacillus erzurumensis]NSL52062.1 stage II sporulation protein D [Calidifontibacillus erzurumensis]